MPNVFDQFDEQPQTPPVAPQQDGNAFDQFDEPAQPGMETQPVQASMVPDKPKSMFDRVADKVAEKIMAAPGAVKSMVTGEGRKENYPEFYDALQLNPQDARTPKGMLNIIRKEYPEAQLDFDKFGNPLVVLHRAQQGNAPNQPYYVNKPGASIADVDYIRTIFDRVAPAIVASGVAAPAGWLTAGGITAAGGAEGEAAAQLRANLAGADEGYDIGEIIKQGLYSGGGEIGGRAIAHSIGALANIFRRMSGKSTAAIDDFITADGKFTPKAIELMKKNELAPDDLSPMLRREIAQSGDDILTAEQMQRYNMFKESGQEPTAGQVTRQFPKMQFEAETAKAGKAGGPLRARFAEQNAQTLQAGDDLVRATGAQSDDAIAAAQTTKKAMGAKYEEMGAKITKAYKTAREARGIDAEIPTDEFFKKTTEVLDDFEDVIPSPIKKRLTEFGLGGEQTRKMTLGEAEKLRKLINARYDVGDNATRTGLNQIRNALDDAVNLLAKGEDESAQLFKVARNLFKERAREFGDNKIVKSIIDGKVGDSKLFSKTVINGEVDDLISLKNVLTKGTPEQIKRGTQAWDDMRGSAVRYLFDNATRSEIRDEMGNLVFSGPMFNKAVKKIGAHKMMVLFNKGERQALERLSKIGELKTPMRGAVNYSGTSSALWSSMKNYLGKIPGVSHAKEAWLANQLRKEVQRALTPAAVTKEAFKRSVEVPVSRPALAGGGAAGGAAVGARREQ